MRKELTPQEWVDAINAGLEYRWIYGREKWWRTNEELFYNTHESLQTVSTPNIVMETVDSILSQLTVQRPQPVILAKSEEAVEKVRIIERLDEDFVRDLDLRQEVEDACLGACLYGKGILKCGYDSEFGFAPQFDAVGGMGGFTLTQFDKQGNRIEFGGAQYGMPWVSNVLPHDFVVPWGTRRLKDAPWCAHRVVRHIEDVKADPKYKSRDVMPTISIKEHIDSYKSRNKAKTVGDTSSSSSTGMFGETEKAYVELWEIHDRRTGKVYVIAPDHDRFLRNEVDKLQTKGLPFVEIDFIPKARTFWVTPDVDYLINSQVDLIDIKLQQQQQRRLSKLKFLYAEDAIDPEEVEKALSPEGGVAVRANGGADLNAAIKPLTPYNNNNQLELEANAVRGDARALVGYSRNQAGEFAGGRTTGTEALIVNEASSNRLSRRGLRVNSMYIRVFEILNSFVYNFWTLPRIIQVLDLSNAAEWVTFVGSDLKGDYSYEILFSDSPIKTVETRKAEAVQLFPILAQDPTVDQVALRKWLSRAFNDVEFTSIFNKELLSDANIQLLMQVLQQIQGELNGVPGASGQRPSGVQRVQNPNGTQLQPRAPASSVGQAQRPV